MSKAFSQLDEAVNELKHFKDSETISILKRVLNLKIQDVRVHNDTAPAEEFPLNKGELRGLKWLLGKLS
jgi:hypothetical protein